MHMTCINNVIFYSRCVKFIVNDNSEPYYIYTSLLDHTIDELKELYHKRWTNIFQNNKI